MRISLYSALAVLSFGLIASQPAAASSFWTCMSPEFGCGSAGSPSGSSHNYRARERVYAGDTERVSNYRGKPRQVAERPERRRAPVRVASLNQRSEERRVISDATQAPKRVASTEARNEEFERRNRRFRAQATGRRRRTDGGGQVGAVGHGLVLRQRVRGRRRRRARASTRPA